NYNNKKKVDVMKTSFQDLSHMWEATVLVLLTFLIINFPAMTYAAGIDTPMGSVLCRAVSWFTGNTGKGLATIAITIIGIGALLGKVSWGMALIVGIGVAIVFGAAGIVDALDGAGGEISGCTDSVEAEEAG